MTALFTAADLAEMRALNEANLPHSAALRVGNKTWEPGGTDSDIDWHLPSDPVWTEPCRMSPASPPQEQLASGTVTNTNTFYVVFAQDVSVPVNSADTFYRLEVTHDIPGITSPLMLYVEGQFFRTYEMERKVLCTTEAPK